MFMHGRGKIIMQGGKEMKGGVFVTALVAAAAVAVPVVLVSVFVHLADRVEGAPAAGGAQSCASVVTVRPHEDIREVAEKPGRTTVFLAGTIDMGTGEDWQAEADSLFRTLPSGSYMLFNPRQEDWDASRPGEMDYQVNWELDHLEEADYIIMNFLPGSRSPITLLELGLHARSGKLLVVCPEEFYRYDNVRITCAKYGVGMCGYLEEAVMRIGSARKGSDSL